mgnify:CR=1 FL=1
MLDATSGGYRCTKCLNTLVVDQASGQCSCPAGRYAAVANDCSDCQKGSYCAGGLYSAANSPAQVACGTNMTTIGARATSIRACGECVVPCRGALCSWCALLARQSVVNSPTTLLTDSLPGVGVSVWLQ